MTRLFGAVYCAFFATLSALVAWRYVHRVADLGAHGERIMSVLVLTAIVGYTAAAILFASWRGSRVSATIDHLNPGANVETMRLGLKAGVYGLIPDVNYRVIREIKDCYGDIFPVGMELTFVQRHYLPYHGGHTVVFRPRPIYLQDEVNADVLGQLDSYLEVVTTDYVK